MGLFWIVDSSDPTLVNVGLNVLGVYWDFFMGRVVGYMLTWTTYGTWLQGDERGWVKGGEILQGNEGILKQNLQRMKQEPVSLNKQQREVVRNSIIESAKRIGQDVLAIAVCSKHVHVVVRNIETPISRIVQRYKRDATYSVRPYGLAGRVWSRGYDVRYCFDEAAVLVRIGYVEGH